MSEYGLFYRDCRNRIFNYLMRLTGDCSLAGDIMQETFARHLEHYGRENREIPLLYGIARNLFTDELRRRNHEAGGEKEGEEPSLNPEHRLMVRSEYRRVLSAMQLLDEDEREILALATGEDLTYREIASLVGISEVSVKVKVHRARLKLREKLKEGDR
ncbi:MAG: RNA polymerase sigma factor [Syntrophales bacterium LBB04]|nr:RNA polymerase sigma factor [Syntrophales bacterium LBB04]